LLWLASRLLRRRCTSSIEMMWSASPKAAKTGQGSAAITASSGLGCRLFTSHSRLEAAPYHTTAARIGTSAANTSGCRPVWQYPATTILLRSAAACFVRAALAALTKHAAADLSKIVVAGYCQTVARA